MAPRDDPTAKALLHLMNRQMSLGWVAWVQCWSELVRKRNAMRQGLGHMLNRQLSGAFEKWQCEAREMKEARRKVGGALRRIPQTRDTQMDQCHTVLKCISLIRDTNLNNTSHDLHTQLISFVTHR